MQSAQSEDEVQVREVAVDRIDHERSMELSPRETLDGHTVEGYTHTFDQLPPIEVWLVDGEDDYLVGDGLHRLQAAKRLKRDTIRAQVRHGSVEGLVEAAILANLRHGRPWTRPEKRNCIDLWLKLHAERSNRWIAEDLAVSQNTVASRREELESTVQIEQLDRLVGFFGGTTLRVLRTAPPARGNRRTGSLRLSRHGSRRQRHDVLHNLPPNGVEVSALNLSPGLQALEELPGRRSLLPHYRVR